MRGLAAQFLAEKLRYISAYLKDSEESQKYDSATGKIFDAIRHSFSRPNIEKFLQFPSARWFSRAPRLLLRPNQPHSLQFVLKAELAQPEGKNHELGCRCYFVRCFRRKPWSATAFYARKNFDASASGFPFGTFAANMLASFLLGLFSALANAEELSRTAEIFLDTGFCATLSTFSTLAWQIADMLKKGGCCFARYISPPRFPWAWLYFCSPKNWLAKHV